MPGFRPITPTSYSTRENQRPPSHQLSPSKRTRSTLDDSTNSQRHSSSSSSYRLQRVRSPTKRARTTSSSGLSTSPRQHRQPSSENVDQRRSVGATSGKDDGGNKNVFTTWWNRMWFPRSPCAPQAEPTAHATPPPPTTAASRLDQDEDMHGITPSKRIPSPSSNHRHHSLYANPSFPPAITTTTTSQPRSSSKTIKHFSSKMAFPARSKTAVLPSPSSSLALGSGGGRTLDPAFIAYEEARKAYGFDCTIARAKGVPEPEKPALLRRPAPPQYLGQASTTTTSSFSGTKGVLRGEGGQVLSTWRKKKPMGANKHSELNNRHRSETVYELATIALSQCEEEQARANDLDAYRQRVMQANEDMETAQTITSRAKKPSHSVARKSSFKYMRDVDSVLSKAKATLETPRPESRTFKYDEYLETQRQLELLSVKPPKRRLFPRSLTPSDLATVKSIFRDLNFISSINGGEVQHKDVTLLQGLGWLNDETITFYGGLINLRSLLYHPLDPKKTKALPQPEEKERRVLDVHAFNHNFYGKLMADGHAGVKRWTRRFDTFKKDRIIIPINQGGNHWVCAAVNIRDKRFEYFDSLGHTSKKVFKTLKVWIREEYKARHKGEEMDLSEWEEGWRGDGEVPLQGNGSDCGVFTCMYMETLSRDVDFFDFEQTHMPYLRTKLVLEMSRRELIEEPWGEVLS